MGLFDLVDKFIVERGSAKVLQERFAFSGEQLAVANKIVLELEASEAALKKKVDGLEIENGKLREVIEEFEKIKKSRGSECRSNHHSAYDPFAKENC